jgi:hypothetical protein
MITLIRLQRASIESGPSVPSFRPRLFYSRAAFPRQGITIGLFCATATLTLAMFHLFHDGHERGRLL